MRLKKILTLVITSIMILSWAVTVQASEKNELMMATTSSTSKPMEVKKSSIRSMVRVTGWMPPVDCPRPGSVTSIVSDPSFAATAADSSASR